MSVYLRTQNLLFVAVLLMVSGQLVAKGGNNAKLTAVRNNSTYSGVLYYGKKEAEPGRGKEIFPLNPGQEIAINKIIGDEPASIRFALMRGTLKAEGAPATLLVDHYTISRNRISSTNTVIELKRIPSSEGSPAPAIITQITNPKNVRLVILMDGNPTLVRERPAWASR